MFNYINILMVKVLQMNILEALLLNKKNNYPKFLNIKV